MEDLKLSISGIRGIVGRSITIPHFLGWLLAWENELSAGPVVLGRDSRPHGNLLSNLAAGALEYRGRKVLIAGIVPTPTVGVLVRAHRAAGGVNLSASHNPVEWNALKLFNSEGLILTPEEFESLLPVWENLPSLDSWPFQTGGEVSVLEDPLDAHCDAVLRQVDVRKIAERRFKVVVDGCRSAGGVALPRILRESGVTVVELDCVPDGEFTRGLEPIPENIRGLCEWVKREKADLGMAVDPDADRLALVSEKGVAIGEEYTLVFAADAALGAGGKGLVANLSSTMVLDAIAKKHGSPIFRSKVGESHVVDLIQKEGAIIGGEGNGGVIFPPVQLGRDSLSGALLVLSLLAREGKPVSELIQTYPPASMVKSKIPADGAVWERVEDEGEDWFADATLNRLDGLKWVWSDRWIHLRPSNTEPIIRILAEGPDQEASSGLIKQVKEKISSSPTGPLHG